MKFDAPADAQGRGASTPDPAVREVASEVESESRTRGRVRSVILERGPITASELGRELGLTAAGVRRHLDGLLDAGVVTTWQGPAHARGRGRPARRFVLTDVGHSSMTTAYDDLAASALRFLASLVGTAAVRRFAVARVAELEARYRPSVDAAGADPAARVEALARALSRDGYAAGTRPLRAGTRSIGTQLCQGHCPVQHVAAEFPELCEAETEAFSRLLGVHVQRLATLAHGEHVCTTHVPRASTTHDPGAPPALPSSVAGTAPTPSQERTSR